MKTMPKLGLGTFRLEGDVAYRTVLTALELGYRHIDTAQMYGNEAEIGRAIAASGIPRQDIFLTTKVWLDKLTHAAFRPSVEASLARLDMEYVDLLLIHWPDSSGQVPMQVYLQALGEAQAQGLSECIGVSNFTNSQLDQAIDILGTDKILTNQVEVHPFLQNRKVVEHCQARNVLVTGYMPLAVGRVLRDTTLERIARQNAVSIAEVVIAWELQQGFATIPSSTRREHLAANIAGAALTLSEDDMAAIAQLDRGERIASPAFAPLWD